MHGIIAYEGPEPDVFDHACEIARDLGARVTVAVSTPRVRLAVMGSGLSVAAASGAVWFGSAAVPASRSVGDTSRLLDGAPDDAVAAAVHDGALVLAAGRGNHRLFVHQSARGTLATSSLTVLARAAETGIDRSYEDFLLGFSFLPLPYTPYADVRALAPGTRVVRGETHAIVAPTQPTPPTPDSFAAAIPELHDRFFASLEELASGETRHAVLLGGFDSMLVAASLRRMGHEVHTYTFSFGDARYEQRNVKDFVESLGIVHHPVTFTPEIVAANLRDFGTWFFQPGALAHYQIHTLVASRQIAADGHDRIFNGDGCDALFLSYPTVNRRAALNRRLESIPKWGVRAALSPLRTRTAERHLGHVGRTMRSMLGNLLLDPPARGHLPNRYMDDYALSLLRTGAAPEQDETVEQIRVRLAKDVEGQIGTRRAFHGNALTGQSKVKVDGCVASAGLPHFTPYAHPAFRTYVAGLPIDYLKRQDDSPAANGKEVLVAMVRQYGLLPEIIIDQPKQSPSDSPIDGWYRNELRDEVMSQLGDLPFEWNHDYVRTVLREKRAEKWYRNRVAIDHHSMQVIGLLTSYASFNRAISR